MAITYAQTGMASGYFSRQDIAVDRITRSLLRVRRVRVFSETHLRCANKPCEQCYATVARMVRRGLAAERFEMVVPAFPCKSPNPALTLAEKTGGGPDWAEIVALNFVAELAEEVRSVRADARVVLALDGRLFEDLCGRLWPSFGPRNVDAYVAGLTREIDRRGWSDLFQLRSLDDYGHGSSEQKRQQVIDQWAVYPTEDHLYQALLKNPEQLADYVGIKKFLEEDGVMSPVYQGLNNARKRQECKIFALGVLHRSAAWSRLIAEEFPGMLRLSIHQWWPHNDSKVGIYLSPGLDNRVSPWRGVGLYDRTDRSWQIVKRQEAEAAGATLAWQDGMPYYCR
jgi:L-tyrosine isonitrile synthase